VAQRLPDRGGPGVSRQDEGTGCRLGDDEAVAAQHPHEVGPATGKHRSQTGQVVLAALAEACLNRRCGQGADRPRWLHRDAVRDQLRRGHEVSRPQAGQPEALGQAPDDDDVLAVGGPHEGRTVRVGSDVEERLVGDEDPAGPSESFQGRPGVEDGGRVGGVVDDHEVGVVRHRCHVEGKPLGHVEDDPGHCVTGRRECGFGLGELRVDDDRVPPGACPGDKGEGLGGAVGREDLLRPCCRAAAARAAVGSG